MKGTGSPQTAPLRSLVSAALVGGSYALALVGLLACSGGSGPSGPARPPAAIAIASGDHQEGKANEALTEPFVVRVTDADGNGVGSVPVTWAVTSGQGSLTLSYTITDDAGFARTGFTPRSLGPSTVTASVAGLQGSPVTFTVETTVLVIHAPPFSGLDPAHARIPVGTTVEWDVGYGIITSTSVPSGGEPFEGEVTPEQRFQFVPGVAGTWRYAVTAREWDDLEGTLTAE